METVQITSKEFRNSQASFFDLADKGTQVIIRRGKKRSYMLAPVSEENLSSLSKETQERIKKAREEYARGEYITCSTIDELHRFLDSL